MMIKRAWGILAILLGLLGQAQAVEMEPYVGGGIGAYLMTNNRGGDTVFGGYALVGMQFTDLLGAEVRLGGSANANNASSTYGIDWYTAYLLRGTIELGQGLSVYGLLGAATLATFEQLRGAAKQKNTSTVFSGGGGIAYDYTDTIHASVEGLFLGSNADARNPNFQGLDAGAITFNVVITR